MRRIFLICLLIFSVNSICFTKTEKVLTAKIGKIIDVSQKVQERYKQWRILYEKVYIKHEIKEKDLTLDQKKLLGEFEESTEFWKTVSDACSWYCGGGPKDVKASSCLPPQNGNTYVASNAHDFDLRTAWIEGAKDYGIGEYIEYYFEPFSPRITEIIIYNGYFKSEKAWEDNSRVKKFKLFINDNPYAILELKNIKAVQYFSVEPLQSKVKDKDLVLKFKILQVYKGKKWKDVAISEINFDGLDVHCFTKDTKIMMADGTEKDIEDLVAGEKILTFNIEKQKIEISTIIQLAKAIHHNLVKLYFGRETIISTDDHPYFVKNKGWCSLNPAKTRIYRNIDQVNSLQVGDEVYFLAPNNEITSIVLKNITYLNQEEEVYTIARLDKNADFFANKLLVGIEQL